MRHVGFVRMLFVGILLSAWAGAQSGGEEPVTVALAAYVVTEVTLDDGRVVEAFAEAEAVFPGQVIEYRLIATNRSEAVLPAGRLTLVGPVPEQTRYVADSATTSGPDGRLEVSLDGEVFAAQPLLVTETDAEGREVEVEVDPEGYRALRWVVLRSLQPGEELVVQYRVVVR